MADVNRNNRPLSPHLQIYRKQITSVVSILTRLTGVAMTLAAVLIVWWFVAGAVSTEYHAVAERVLTSWFGDLVLLGSLWALWFHTLSGIRHLVWDTGAHFDVQAAAKSGWAIVIGSVVLTVLTVLVV